MDKGEEDKLSELTTVFPRFKTRNYSGAVGVFTYAMHMQNMKSLVLSKGSGEEGNSTRWDESTVPAGGCMARMLLSSKCLS